MQFKSNLGFAKEHGVFVTDVNADNVFVSCRAEIACFALVEMRRFFGKKLIIENLTKEVFSEKISKAYNVTNQSTLAMAEGIEKDIDLTQIAEELETAEEILDSENEAPVIHLLNAIMRDAIQKNVSDIHIETYEEKLSIRFRMDGILHEVVAVNRALAPFVIARVKVMAKLDIAEKRIPQDGRISLTIAGRPVDVRVSTIPSTFGERAVLRLLDKKRSQLDMSELGIPPAMLETINELIAQPHGILLVTGPTGSGKSTTLYAALNSLNSEDKNIMTVEDPIEYVITGISQTQVNEKINMSFAKGLRAILRQDPDVVMVGEIRDRETANIAIQASLTGHLVFSTLHTNRAIGVISRLQDMKVELFLLSTSLIGIVAQRLVRILCSDCKVEKLADKSELSVLGLATDKDAVIFHEQGCENCNYTGFKGRTGIYEIIKIDEQLKDMIYENRSELEMSNYAKKLSKTMQEEGMDKVLSGITTISEVLRVTRD